VYISKKPKLQKFGMEGVECRYIVHWERSCYVPPPPRSPLVEQSFICIESPLKFYPLVQFSVSAITALNHPIQISYKFISQFAMVNFLCQNNCELHSNFSSLFV
jgi:hypothetical protein